MMRNPARDEKVWWFLIYGARRSRRFNMAMQIDVKVGPNLGLAMNPALRKQFKTLVPTAPKGNSQPAG
jgi:hypothetical protein